MPCYVQCSYAVNGLYIFCNQIVDTSILTWKTKAAVVAIQTYICRSFNFVSFTFIILFLFCFSFLFPIAVRQHWCSHTFPSTPHQRWMSVCVGVRWHMLFMLYICVFICFFCGKCVDGFIIHHFPSNLQFRLHHPSATIFAHKHIRSALIITPSKWCDRKRRKVEFFFCDCYQYGDTYEVADETAAAAATNKLNVMIVCGWVFEDKRCQDIAVHSAIFDVNTGHKILRLNDQNG